METTEKKIKLSDWNYFKGGDKKEAAGMEEEESEEERKTGMEK